MTVQFFSASLLFRVLNIALVCHLVEHVEEGESLPNKMAEKLQQAVYDHYPHPKQLTGENDLPQKLQNLIEESIDGQKAEFWWPSFGEADGHFFDYINTVP